MESKHTPEWTVSELFEKQESELRILTSEISELLAVMHGDGGHHRAKVGTIQAIKDAKELLFTKWQSPDQVDSLRAEVDRLKKELEEYKVWNSITNTTINSVQQQNHNLIQEVDRLMKEKKEAIECLQQWLKNVPIIDDRYSYIKGELTNKTTDLLTRIK